MVGLLVAKPPRNLRRPGLGLGLCLGTVSWAVGHENVHTVRHLLPNLPKRAVHGLVVRTARLGLPVVPVAHLWIEYSLLNMIAFTEQPAVLLKDATKPGHLNSVNGRREG